MQNKKRRFKKIISDIKSVKIQGARNVAKFALKAYSLFPNEKTKEKLLSLRETEPMMENVLDLAEKGKKYSEIEKHFSLSQNKINKNIYKLIKKGDVIFTHCHSTNVVNALIYAKNRGKKFEVVNTETRPLMQGRKTAKELKKAGIKVTQYVDSAAMIAITRGKGNMQVDKVLFGADALTKSGIINKVGSGMFSQVAYYNNVPVYIVADSWKFTNKKVPIENRDLNEVWNHAPKKIKIQNPAFEFVPKKYIKAIISELGILKYEKFVDKAEKINP